MDSASTPPGVTVIGAGEAFDGERVNCSALLEGERRVLCDCGPTVPFALWRLRSAAPDLLDAVYISHFHGDHVFGLPFLLARMREEGRTRALTLVGQPGLVERAEQVTRLAYPNVWAKLGFAIEPLVLEPGRMRRWEGYRLSMAWSDHSLRNGSLRVEVPGSVFGYSGDGAPTEATRALFAGADILVHEAFAAEAPPVGHAAASQVIALATAAKVDTLALVHVSRTERAAVERAVAARPAGGAPRRVLLPASGDHLAFSSR